MSTQHVEVVKVKSYRSRKDAAGKAVLDDKQLPIVDWRLSSARVVKVESMFSQMVADLEQNNPAEALKAFDAFYAGVTLVAQKNEDTWDDHASGKVSESKVQKALLDAVVSGSGPVREALLAGDRPGAERLVRESMATGLAGASSENVTKDVADKEHAVFTALKKAAREAYKAKLGL